MPLANFSNNIAGEIWISFCFIINCLYADINFTLRVKDSIFKMKIWRKQLRIMIVKSFNFVSFRFLTFFAWLLSLKSEIKMVFYGGRSFDVIFVILLIKSIFMFVFSGLSLDQVCNLFILFPFSWVILRFIVTYSIILSHLNFEIRRPLFMNYEQTDMDDLRKCVL